jgi:RimJ/RimL family protein N-acetyltransferase
MSILETERLRLRELTLDDAPFVLALLNDPDWRRYIGDRGVRTLDAARAYIQDGPLAMYARVQFGLWLVVRKSDGQPLGLCGLLTRPGLADVDIGFAFMPAFRGQGYAREAAAACLQHGLGTLGLKRIVAIATHDNHASTKLLESLGMRFEKTVRIPNDDEELNLFATAL